MRRGIMMHPGAQVVKEATLQHCNVASCNRTYREISKAAASKSVCKPVATPKVSKGRSESPLVASAEAKPCETEKARRPFSLLSTRNLFLVRGFARLRADEVLSPRGKVPKGRRGRPKGACGMAAPGPPVAKLQCTASLAGARPAGFTSVPGRATVAFKVGFHFVKAKSLRDPRIRLWRKRGLAQLIPPPALRRRSILGVSARGRCGRDTLLRYVPRLRCQAICVPDAAPDWLLAQSQTKSRARYGPCRSRDKGKCPWRYKGGSGGIPRPFEGGIGSPGGHRGEVGIPPAPLAGGATPRRKISFTGSLPTTCLRSPTETIFQNNGGRSLPMQVQEAPNTHIFYACTNVSPSIRAVKASVRRSASRDA